MKTKIDELMPFGQQIHIRNYKLWRGNYRVKSADGPTAVACLYVSDLQGAWCVRLPETFEIYAIMCQAIESYFGDDEDRKRDADAVLGVLLDNMIVTTTTCNGFFHRAIKLVTMAYTFPDVLSVGDKDHDGFMKDVTETRDAFIEWHKEYADAVKNNEPDDDELRKEDVAEQAADILTAEN